ncbi:sialidase family protein [Paenibacillus oceani]|uniref:Exo-alpha-sialidase n=1 Tax=Paenibacillus oceani TaxID=2772510 RepID=A0A927H0R3_9BACL|nr:sialidase family protein [Paenibacillus oceani]MBD2864361.1 exo-alpha-sialidase [Paenibacillus oceani]
MGSLIKIEDVVLYKDGHYNTFPSMIKTNHGELLIAFRQAPDRLERFPNGQHVDPAAKAVLIRSRDNGRTWDNKATVIYDDYSLGISDPCLTQLRDGTIFATFFTHQVLLKSDVPVLQPHTMDCLLADKWVIRAAPGFTLRSADGGRRWDEPIPVPASRDSLYGGGLVDKVMRGHVVEMEDGSLLSLMCTRPRTPGRVQLNVTTDRGRTWEMVSRLPDAEDTIFYEPNLYRTASGKLVAFLRSVKKNVPNERANPLFTCESIDNGRTWANLREHPIYTPNPFDVIALQSGRVLLSYGYRHPPYGIRARLLDAECENIGEVEEVMLREDGCGFDIGYTGAAQLDNGDILIVYYYFDRYKGERYIAGTHCREG